MALTAGTFGPIVPYAMAGSGQSAYSPMYARISANQTTAIVPGDILIDDSATGNAGFAIVDNDGPLSAAILGVATGGASASTGYGGDADLIEYAPALPGALFVGSFVTDVSNDLVDPDYGDVYDNDAPKDIGEDPVNGYAVIIDASTANNVFIVGFDVGQFRGLPFDSATDGTPNPRVIFRFANSVFIYPVT